VYVHWLRDDRVNDKIKTLISDGKAARFHLPRVLEPHGLS